MKTITTAWLLSALFTSFQAGAAAPDATQESDVMLSRKNYQALGAPAGPYSASVRHQGTLYLSGLTAFGSKAQGQSIAEQAEAIFKQLKQVAEAEGIGLHDLIKVTVFVTSLEDLDALREVLSRNYQGAYPASSLVQVAGLFSPEVNIEIEALFALPL
ncbi:RidA family protein [Pseudomonas protegens]|uniref:RidA family protein n=1 Tax=Pseudomonas protegens TaxID=380021 RepID=UPI00277153C7|nr:RidA family protein [Pseudomonas protegens]MDP9525307.1 RidA family protein [Pseudomonas protegens]